MSVIVRPKNIHIVECLEGSPSAAVLQDCLLERGYKEAEKYAGSLGLRLRRHRRKIFVLPKGKEYTVNGVTFRMLPITEGFDMAEGPVSQELYQAVMGANPAYFKNRPKCPVESVSWYDAVRFCEELSRLTGENFRLPTETEWQYAASPDGRTFPWGEAEPTIELVCWNRSYKEGTEDVGNHPTGVSPFGCMDMSGNVWEWTGSAWKEHFEPFIDKDWKAKIPDWEAEQVRGLRGQLISVGASLEVQSFTVAVRGLDQSCSPVVRVPQESIGPKVRFMSPAESGREVGTAGHTARKSDTATGSPTATAPSSSDSATPGGSDPKAPTASGAVAAGATTPPRFCEGPSEISTRLTTATMTSDSAALGGSVPKASATSLAEAAGTTITPRTCELPPGPTARLATATTTSGSAALVADPKAVRSSAPARADASTATRASSSESLRAEKRIPSSSALPASDSDVFEGDEDPKAPSVGPTGALCFRVAGEWSTDSRSACASGAPALDSDSLGDPDPKAVAASRVDAATVPTPFGGERSTGRTSRPTVATSTLGSESLRVDDPKGGSWVAASAAGSTRSPSTSESHFEFSSRATTPASDSESVEDADPKASTFDGSPGEEYTSPLTSRSRQTFLGGFGSKEESVRLQHVGTLGSGSLEGDDPKAHSSSCEAQVSLGTDASAMRSVGEPSSNGGIAGPRRISSLSALDSDSSGSPSPKAGSTPGAGAAGAVSLPGVCSGVESGAVLQSPNARALGFESSGRVDPKAGRSSADGTSLRSLGGFSEECGALATSSPTLASESEEGDDPKAVCASSVGAPGLRTLDTFGPRTGGPTHPKTACLPYLGSDSSGNDDPKVDGPSEAALGLVAREDVERPFSTMAHQRTVPASSAFGSVETDDPKALNGLELPAGAGRPHTRSSPTPLGRRATPRTGVTTEGFESWLRNEGWE